MTILSKTVPEILNLNVWIDLRKWLCLNETVIPVQSHNEAAGQVNPSV